MATLSVRNLPEEIHAALRQRAAQAGISMEAEVRNILVRACQSKPLEQARLQETLAKIRQWALQLPGIQAKPHSAVDTFLAERRREAMHEW